MFSVENVKWPLKNKSDITEYIRNQRNKEKG